MNTSLIKYYLLFLLSTLLVLSTYAQDAVADNMLLYQRGIGGWPKHINEVKVDYNKKLTETEKAGLLKDKVRNDATIDNSATTKEIRYLLKAYKTGKNEAYLQAAENGIRYLVAMQKTNGGFPQFFPDSSSYRGQITYNDNAMVNALNVLWDAAHRSNGFEVVNENLQGASALAVAKGVECLLKTQVVVNGKLTAWCAQHDKKTMAPVKARAFELASLSGAESVAITNFLMKVENPSLAIKNSIHAAVQWLNAAAIKGYKYADIVDKSQPRGIDRVLVKDEAGTVWARFYDLETGLPLFAGRDGVKKGNLAEVEVERRTGYAWYGTWPQKLLAKEYPEWSKKNGTGVTAYKKPLVVSADGKGDFASIQAAINSLSDSSASPRIIQIKAGLYNEKIFLTKHNIVLQGEDRETTKIIQSIARDEWRCEHTDDWGVATLNIDGNDITLQNLSIINDYGFTQKEPRTVLCAGDSSGKKTITYRGHQMALRSIQATRLKAINCRFSAYAGDTVSPWNTVDGMFYFKDCIMEGGVDFYCPRGWAWAENCTFFANTGDAAIWHDGSGKEDFKTVLKNCSFNGYEGFRLGRFHRDAQFFLIGCTFSKAMADRDIYQVKTTNVLQWSRRVYYAGCKREGGDYAWFANNLATAKGAPDVKDITVEWLFGKQWKPEAGGLTLHN